MENSYLKFRLIKYSGIFLILISFIFGFSTSNYLAFELKLKDLEKFTNEYRGYTRSNVSHQKSQEYLDKYNNILNSIEKFWPEDSFFETRETAEILQMHLFRINEDWKRVLELRSRPPNERAYEFHESMMRSSFEFTDELAKELNKKIKEKQ